MRNSMIRNRRKTWLGNLIGAVALAAITFGSLMGLFLADKAAFVVGLTAGLLLVPVAMCLLDLGEFGEIRWREWF